MPFLIFVVGWFDWQVIKTESFTVIYPPGYEWAARQSIENLEKYRMQVSDLTGNRARNTPVVIEDVGTTSNGFANPVFYNIHIFTYPPGFGSELEGIENWHRLVAVHEYTHIGHLTKTSGVPRLLTTVFGAPFQSNMYSPGWITEGITVFSESQLSPYEGRLNDGFFDSYIGARVREDRFPSIIEATNEPLAFPYGKIYLYGGEFFNFLSNRYGREKFRQFFDCYGSYPWAPLSAVLPCAGLDIAGHHVYGKTFPALFADWKAYEKTRFASWRMPGEKITDKGWYIYSLVRRADKLYYVREVPMRLSAFNYRSVTQIVELDPASLEERVVKNLTSYVTTAIKVKGDCLYFAAARSRKAPNLSYEGFGITSELYKINLTTSEETFILKDDMRAFDVLPADTIIYAKDRSGDFGSEIWYYHQGTREKKAVLDHLVNEIAVDSGTIIVAARKNNENWDIYRLDGSGLAPIIASPWVEGALSLDQNIVSYSANYEKVHSRYLYDLSDSTLYRLTGSGFASDGEIISDTLYFIGLSGNGHDIYKQQVDAKEYRLPASAFEPARPEPDTIMSVTRGNYCDIVKTLLPAWRQPFIFPADTTFKKWIYGGLLVGGDATNENMYAFVFAYDQIEEEPIVTGICNSYFFSPFQLAAFYDHDDDLTFNASVPLYRDLGPGLTSVTVAFGSQLFDEYERKEITPRLNLNWRYPLTDVAFAFYCPTEKIAWGSMIDRTAYEAAFLCKQIALSGQFALKAQGYVDEENPETPHFQIRAHDAAESKSALIMTAEYDRHLHDIRRGLWNPNVYFEGLYAGLFIDVAVNNRRELFYTMGVKIELETKVAFGFILIAPQFGVGLTERRQVKLFLNISPGIDL